MRKFCWQRWALMLLLVTRLVIGELGHAMPVAAMGAAEQAVSIVETDSVACPEHDRGSHEMPTAEHASHESGEHDCCKSGDCECPCLHVPCAALDAHALTPIAIASLRTAPGADAVISQRPSGLFRPPA